MDQSTADAIKKLEDQLLVVNGRLALLEGNVNRILEALKAFKAAIVLPS